jgi:hypothetical protein
MTRYVVAMTRGDLDTKTEADVYEHTDYMIGPEGEYVPSSGVPLYQAAETLTDLQNDLWLDEVRGTDGDPWKGIDVSDPTGLPKQPGDYRLIISARKHGAPGAKRIKMLRWLRVLP